MVSRLRKSPGAARPERRRLADIMDHRVLGSPFVLFLVIITPVAMTLILAQDLNQQQQQPPQAASGVATSLADPPPQPTDNDNNNNNNNDIGVLPPLHRRPNVRVNIREWTTRVSEDIRLVSNRTSCGHKIELLYEREAEYQQLDPVKTRELILGQINGLLAQHRAALNALVGEAEKAALAHNFIKNLRINYTDVHRIRNELEPSVNQVVDPTSSDPFGLGGQAAGSLGSSASGLPQFTSIGGGTPVPGPPEWQTPIKSIIMQVNKNFGDIPVNTSMSAVHLPLPIYPGLPEIMNGIAWTERLDGVFRRNLAQYMHVHHQYYGDHLGFLRTFPAHKWRIPRTDPDLFDARMRPWYVAGASMPKDIVILIDTSGSMTGLRREIAKGVVFEILDTLTNNDHFAVLRFSESVTPVGLPKCSLRTPRLVPQLEQECPSLSYGGHQQQQHQQQQQIMMMDKRELNECLNFRRQWESRGQYLRDNPNVVLGKNGSYLADDAYKKSIYNVTQDIRDAYLLPATSRNIRYLKSNFTMPTAGIANFTHALMAAFELLQGYNRTGDLGSQCNQAIMLITDGAISSHEDIFNRYNYPHAPIRLFTYMIGREVGDIRPTKAMACRNRGYYTHVINLGEVREQVQKYLPVMARPLVLAHNHPITWTNAYGDETHQVLTDWVLEIKRRERARIMLNEERERLSEANSSDVINIELTNIPEYDELPLVDEQLKSRIICEDATDDLAAMDQSLEDELDPLGYNDLACHWTSRRADLLTSVVKPVFDLRNSSIFFERILSKNVWTERETHVRNAQLLGVAAVDLRIADIMRAAPSHLLGPNGYAILLGQNGFLMHHPDFRALLEDPFDKHSKILKPYFSAVDLTHIEQVHHNETGAPPASASAAAATTTTTMQPVAADSFVRRKADDIKLFKLREAAVRRGTGFEIINVKRPLDCRRRPHIRKQAFYYGPVKDTPFSFMLAFPQGYGLNRVQAKLPLDAKIRSYLTPSDYDLWTIHPDYRYCEQAGVSQGQHQNDSLATLVKLIQLAAEGATSQLNEIEYEDLSAISGTQMGEQGAKQSTLGQRLAASQQKSSSAPSLERYVCDKELFPSLLFDAKATYEPPDSTCGTPFFHQESCQSAGGGGSFYGSMSKHRKGGEEFCSQTPEEMRSKLAEIYGLEMSFLATRSGLTRTRVFELSPRIKKLAELFIQRHNKALDEAWYSRTVDWNMRFGEDATLISVPFNAYIRLIAKLRQRITQRHPSASNGTNCDPIMDAEEPEPGEPISPNGTAAGPGEEPAERDSEDKATQTSDGGGTQSPSDAPTAARLTADGQEAPWMQQNDQPDGMGQRQASSQAAPSSGDQTTPSSGTTTTTTTTTNVPPSPPPTVPQVNYSDYSTFDFLDLLANSSVHVSATQSVIVNKRTKQRSAVAVTGLLYDYATFARRFLNSTSLSIRTYEYPSDTSYNPDSVGGQQQHQGSGGGGGGGGPVVKVDICPNGQCPTQCGLRNDSIDCLLVDNNGYIVVGEELPHIGRSLVDYDEKLMQSLVEHKVYHQVDYVDYQAICARNDQVDAATRQQQQAQQGAPGTGAAAAAQQQQAVSSAAYTIEHPFRWQLLRSVAANLVSSILWTMSTLYSAFFLKSTMSPEDLFAGEHSLLGQLYQWQRSAIMADAQSAIANQSLLALLPNKTYLRPCEKTITLYETRPTESGPRLYRDSPEYFVTKCGCSGWYVYDSVPKTNLIMLIVNTTTACRRCESPSAPVSLVPNSLAPVVTPLIDTTIGGANMPVVAGGQTKDINGSLSAAAYISPNKTAEDQVCAMLERDSQLYVQRSVSSCLTSHPDEANIHICGAAAHLVVSWTLIVSLLVLATFNSYHHSLDGTRW